jgi:hypothetical protein
MSETMHRKNLGTSSRNRFDVWEVGGVAWAMGNKFDAIGGKKIEMAGRNLAAP